MTDATTSPVPAKRGGWLRKLVWIAGGLLVLLVVLYFVLTSSAFFKGVILPKAGQALHATVTADEASLSPFSQVRLRNLQIRTTGAEPLVTAAEVRVRYSLWSILGGTIKVEEIVLSSPVVQIVENADGSSNLDPILNAEPKPPTAEPPSPSSKPPQIDLKKLALNKATVRRLKKHRAGGSDLTELSNVTVTLDGLKNGQSGQLSLAADIKVDNHPPAPATNALLQAKLAGSFTFDLAADLKPTAIKGQTRLDVLQAGGAMSELAALGALLDCEVTPTDIKQVALRFQKGGSNLGELRLSGPFDLAKTEGRLKAEILSIDRQVLNLVGAASGIDFGTTTINSTNQIDLAKSGSLITAVGRFEAAKVSLTQKGQTTPTLDLQLAYHISVNKTDQSALLQALTLIGTQNQRPLLRADLTSPMNVAWGKATQAVGDSTLKLTLTGLNLADWKPFLGDVAPAGNASLTLNLLSQQAGQQLSLDLNSQIDGLTARFGSNQISQANVTLQTRGQATDLKKIKLTEYRVQLTQQGQPLLSLAGSGQLDRESQDADVQVTFDAAVARLLTALGMSDPKKPVPSAPLETKIQLDASLRKQVLDLRRCQLSLSPTSRAKNELQVQGQVDMSQTNALHGSLKLRAESLDVTPYYDLFLDEPRPAAAPSSTKASIATGPPSTLEASVEPAAQNLPFRNFDLDVNIGRLYLREVDVANWQAMVKIDGGRVSVKPFQLALNGAPVNATIDLNLGVPGYVYDISCNAAKVPVEPLANSFSPEYRGQAKGELIANVQVKGAGTTGAALQKNLGGQIDLSFTNANIQLAGPKAKLIITPIALALRLPELIKSPVNYLITSMKLGEGRIQLSQLDLVGELFSASSQGDIRLATVLTNSTLNNLPVNLALRRSLAERAKLVPPDAPTNTAYVKLPVFSKVGGTFGEPKVENNMVVLGGLLAQSLTAIPGLEGTKAGQVLGGVGGLLTGGKTGGTNQPSTNKPAFNPLDLLKKPKK